MESPDPNPNSHVLFFGEDVGNKPVGHRKVGFVFQHYALFKHMSVFENIAFGLRVRSRSQRPTESAFRDKVNSLLKLIQLEGFGTRFPKQLSGGQRQRVALARALAIEPQVLLLDEPFGALDAKVRKGLRDWLRRLYDELNTTTILVTHDQEEALEVSDRVVIMDQARIEQVGAPAEVFHDPISEFVMDFLGNVNVFQGRIQHGQAAFGTQFAIEGYCFCASNKSKSFCIRLQHRTRNASNALDLSDAASVSIVKDEHKNKLTRKSQ